MAALPLLKPREVEIYLLALGFVVVRQRGSHRQYRHLDGRATTVAFHSHNPFTDFAEEMAAQLAAAWHSFF